MQAVTVSDLKLAKVKLEKDINFLLVAFKLANGVSVSDLKLNTYLCGSPVERYSEVEVEIIL